MFVAETYIIKSPHDQRIDMVGYKSLVNSMSTV